MISGLLVFLGVVVFWSVVFGILYVFELFMLRLVVICEYEELKNGF